MRRAEIATSVGGEPFSTSQVPVLGALGLRLQEALRAPRPASGNGPSPGEVVVANQREGYARGASLLPVGDVSVERALARLDAPLRRTRPGGCLADQLEVLRGERSRVRGDEEVVSLAPRPSGGRGSGALDELIDRVHAVHQIRNRGEGV